MKKNISINISGIIFHIEEDGFDTLKKYLDSINRYFSSFEDSSEILADIESRIAEIFLSKLNEEKQIITADDVQALVATMGSVSDFKAAEEENYSKTETTSEDAPSEDEPQANTSSERRNKTYTPPKQLQRDQKRKILGGVCSGIANYMNVDAVWIRLLFALLAFAYGFTILVYIIMWIAVPGSYELDEPEIGKKLYRDSERKVIGGVSGGLAAFLNIDIVAVRVLFILFTFLGGLGFFTYVVMWLVLPEAKTLTDKMQMQGEPVTLSNIESTLKKNQTDKNPEEESIITKILLFPFRLLGTILSALAKIIVPIFEVLRVAIGVMVVFMGIGFIFATIVAGGITLGIFSGTALSVPWFVEHNEFSIPIDAFTRAIPGWVIFSGFLAALIPSIVVILLGVSIVAKRIIFSAAAGWSLFVIFFICIAMLSVGIPKIVFAFKERGEYKMETTYNPTGKTAVLKINEVGLDDFHGTQLTLKGYDGKDFKLVQEFSAQGSTRQKAIENAQMVDYHVDVQDSVFTFDSNIRFKPEAIFRGQHLSMTMYIPYNYPFIMDNGVSRFITQYVNWEYMDGNTWKMTEKGLECITCPVEEEPEKEEEENPITLSDFNEVEISGKFDVRIIAGQEYAVELIGTEQEKSRYKVYQLGKTLIIDYEGKKKFNWDIKDLKIDEMQITITMPSLEKVEAVGYGTVRFENFNADNFEINLRGPVKLRGELDAQNLILNMSGKSEADLSGRSNRMNADIEFASTLKAYNLEVNDAMVEVNGASKAKVNVTGTLEIEEGVASDIDFRGNPRVIKRN
ncbi:MAG: PspC domain-containing protein [Cyclobacteriaceae bacterium]|nr:PspC domain-containing protein [Cyclobacteriaceae bacterium]